MTDAIDGIRKRKMARYMPSMASLAILIALLAAPALAQPTASVPTPARPVTALQDIEVVVDHTLVTDAPAAVAVTVRAAADWTTRAPLRGARVRAVLHPALSPAAPGKQPKPIPLTTATTDRDGHAPLRFRIPAVPPGAYHLQITVTSPLGRDQITHPVQLIAAVHLHLRTDRAVYRPGETLNWRITAPGAIDAHPRRLAVDLAIRDPRGTVMWRGRADTDATGMIAGRLPLSDDAPLGTWTLQAETPGGQARRTIDLRPARRPAFFVELSPTPTGARVVARHPSGEPVKGRVELRAGDAVIDQPLDAGGALEATLPAGPITAKVTDGADRHETAHLDRSATEASPEIAIIAPETITAGRPAAIYVIATGADASPHLIDAIPTLRIDDIEQTPAASAPGVARFDFTPHTPGKTPGQIMLTASIDAGEAGGAGAGTSLTVDDADDTPHIRPETPVIDPGAAIAFAGRARPGDSLIITLHRREVPVAAISLHPAPDGRFAGQLTAPPGTFGLTTLRVTRAAFDPATGELTTAHAGHTLYLRPAPLTVTLTAALRHRPGATVPLGVHVTDARGRPVARAGLAAEVVDTRALALGDTGPDLATALRHLDLGTAAVAGAAFADLLDAPTDPATTLARAAVLAALPVEPPEAAVHDDAVARWTTENARLATLLVPLTEALVTWPGAIARREATATAAPPYTWAMPLDRALAHLGWTPTARRDPWGRPTTWTYLPRFAPDVQLTTIAPPVTDERLHLIIEALAETPLFRQGDPRALTALPPHLRVDAWGHAIALATRPLPDRLAIDLIAPGPDGLLHTPDDQALTDLFGPAGLPERQIGGLGLHGLGSGGSGRASHVAYGRAGTARTAAAPVRSRFDETALWRVGIPTDPTGRATLPFTLPDSLTGWRIRVEALARDGSTGAADGRLETWLPLSIDVALPDHLTVGDRYEAPLILHNRTDTPRTLTLTARVDGAARATAPPATLTLPPGEVRSIPLALEALHPGEARVRLDLTADGHPLDAVLRTFPIEAPGPLERRVISTTLDPRRPTLTFTLPEAAPGTLRAALRIYRGPTDALLDGLDSLLAAPYGCFEQTTSTTYPNLMVLRLLDPQNPRHAPLRARALDFIATGYQRLTSYEVPGGGFSWFGEAPANRVLTAYGLMQFADMAAIYPIDPTLIPRTRDWLIAAQRPDGGWDPDKAWLHDWSAAQGEISTTAWIAHALATIGGADQALTRARTYLRAHAETLTADPYLLALWAHAEDDAHRELPLTALRALIRPATPDATDATDAIAPAPNAIAPAPHAIASARDATDATHAPDPTAYLPAGRTLFATTGQAADVQTTALAARLLHRHAHDATPLHRWLWTARAPNGGWGSTQGTVLALQAALDARPPKTLPPLPIKLDNRPLPPLNLQAIDLPTLHLPPTLTPGPHTITLAPTTPLLADLRWQWRTLAPPTAQTQGIEVKLTPDRPTTPRGQPITLTLTLHNPGSDPIAMPTAEIPIPPGFTPDPTTLEALKTRQLIARYETLGTQINLYLPALAPGQTLTLPYRLDPDATCHVTHRGATAYAYYTPTTRGTSAPFTLQATPPPDLAHR